METVRIGFGMRFVAALIDGVIVFVLSFVPAFVLALLHLPVVGAVVGGLFGMAYYSLEIFKAQTVGKMIFKYKITKQDGTAAGRDQLIKRWGYKQVPQAISIVAALLSAVVPALAMLNYLGLLAALVIVVGACMMLKPEKLALHDKLFGTAVYGPATVSISIPQAADVLPATAAATTPVNAA